MRKTYKEWAADRRHVIKGQKAVARNDEGVALFDLLQTEKNRDTFSSVGDYDYEYEGSMEEMLGGSDWYK